MDSILLIDDKEDVVAELKELLLARIDPHEVQVNTWVPVKGDEDSFDKFTKLVGGPELVLVVTDYDLTGRGQTGLFGSTIVAWCQGRTIPVGDYSRYNRMELPKEPNLFELRVPVDANEAADYIAEVFRGFRWIRRELASSPHMIAGKRSPAAVIAALLKVPALEAQFSLYSVRIGATSAALVERITHSAPRGVSPTDTNRLGLLSYIAGHLLLNAILRFPGPVLSLAALAAYVGVNESEGDVIREYFKPAIYDGPFGKLDSYFWLWRVDEVLKPLIDDLAENRETETHGELHRLALEKKFAREFCRHTCERCHGNNGGFWCPFTRRAVCLRADCSVGANSWIPQGARICRIERDFYDEWSPILGI